MSAPIIKVALSGTHGVGKTFIVDNVAALAMSEGWQTQIVYSPTRHVKSLGKDYGMANNKDGDWHFHTVGDGSQRAARVELLLNYGFDSVTLSKVVGPVFDRIAASMVDAFVKRAEQVYG